MIVDFIEIANNCLQYQFGYSNIHTLMLEKSKILNKYLGTAVSDFGSQVLDYNTCISSALDYFWGKFFKISRVFKDSEGRLFSLTDNQFREIIKIKAFATTWNGTIATLNNFLTELFKTRGICYVIDNQDMTFSTFTFLFELEPWEKYLFATYDILPRSAGVGVEIIVVETKYFGLLGYNGLADNPIRTGFNDYQDNNPNGETFTYYKQL